MYVNGKFVPNSTTATRRSGGRLIPCGRTYRKAVSA